MVILIASAYFQIVCMSLAVKKISSTAFTMWQYDHRTNLQFLPTGRTVTYILTLCHSFPPVSCRDLSWVKIYNVDQRYEANRIDGEAVPPETKVQ